MSSSHDAPCTSWPALDEALEQRASAEQLVEEFLDQSRNPATPVTQLADRWILASNLHKAVRRGQVLEAAATAEALHRVDARYLWGRLPVLALEEVAFGDLALCAGTADLARDARLRREHGDRLAGYVGGRLAAALKCRSPCDLLSLLIAERGEEAFEAEVAGLPVAVAIDRACTTTAPSSARSVAWLRLDRLPIRGGNERAAVLMEMADRLRIPLLIRQLLLAGKGWYGLPALLPVTRDLMRESPLRVQVAATDMAGSILQGPFLLSALDAHTRIGQRAIRFWLGQAAQDLSRFLTELSVGRRAERIVRTALFHIEGSLLDRRLTNNCLDQLLRDTELAELRAAGLPAEHAAELYALMHRYLPALNAIRRQEWSGDH